MTIRHGVALAVLACAHVGATAQPAAQRPQDAGATVPDLTYSSAFEGFASAVSAQDSTPDKAWRSANEQVANPDTVHAHHKHEPESKKPSPDAQAPVKHQHQHEGK